MENKKNISIEKMGFLIFLAASDMSKDLFNNRKDLKADFYPMLLFLYPYIYFYTFTRQALSQKYNSYFVDKVLNIAYFHFYKMSEESLGREEIKELKETVKIKEIKLEELRRTSKYVNSFVNPLTDLAKSFIYDTVGKEVYDAVVILEITLAISSWIELSTVFISDYNLVM